MNLYQCLFEVVVAVEDNDGDENATDDDDDEYWLWWCCKLMWSWKGLYLYIDNLYDGDDGDDVNDGDDRTFCPTEQSVTQRLIRLTQRQKCT